MKLYTYFRSTAAYRVRIALNLKGLNSDLVPVNLVSKEHKNDSYTKLNPQGLVPALELDSGEVLNQSMAILEYLEETESAVSILPSKPIDRAWVRGFSYEIASDVHPLNNLRVLQYLENVLKVSSNEKQSWYEHWVTTAFSGLEARLAQRSASQLGQDSSAQVCFGDTPSMADCLLIPQIYNAQRFNCDLEPYSLIRKINEYCLGLSAFAEAAPDKQADAPLA